MTTIGSLFSGYGGLDMGVQLALGTMRTAWVSDIEPGPQTILTRRYPHTPNLGDITSVDWGSVEPVDIITGGSPCQDLSMAGARAGMKPGTRSGLWESMTHAIEQLQPRLVVWENVRGALSAEAYSDSNMGFFEGLVDERNPSQRPAKEKDKPLRALGRVLGDLANLGYDAEWTTVRASDVGAPHRRERVFVIAYPLGDGREGGFTGRPLPEHSPTESNELLLPSPCAQQSGNSPELHLSKKPGRERVTDLAIIVENGLLATGGRLLPTPTAERPDGRKSDAFREGRTTFYDVVELNQWGDYAPAIHRWENILGRSAPDPTEPSKTGKPQLSPAFVEWMMGLPAGWVTHIPISRAQQLRALGNGVVPQQAAYAITEMLAWQEAAA